MGIEPSDRAFEQNLALRVEKCRDELGVLNTGKLSNFTTHTHRVTHGTSVEGGDLGGSGNPLMMLIKRLGLDLSVGTLGNYAGWAGKDDEKAIEVGRGSNWRLYLAYSSHTILDFAG